MWDIRQKGWIYAYKGHRMPVNSLKFSPDGQWIASGGDDGLVKVAAMILICRYFSQYNE
jgi:WD40 repeat protein